MTDPVYVLDSSTLFNLGHRGRLEKLAACLRRESVLWITPQVRSELRVGEAEAYFEKRLQPLVGEQTSKKSRFSLNDIQAMAEVIHQAEISAILLAAEHSATVSLDERTARRVAARFGVKTTGTLGLMRIGLQRGWMTDEECLEAVRRMRTVKGPCRIPAPGIDEDFLSYTAGFS